MQSDSYLKRFVAAYIEAALWSSTDEDGDPLDGQYDADDLSEETLEEMHKDCKDFVETQSSDLGLAQLHFGYSPERAGHDFWLTRNGHGAGFWDRGLGDLGDHLSEAARVYGEVWLYVGDDGKVWIQ